jgi:hypothetical protein
MVGNFLIRSCKCGNFLVSTGAHEIHSVIGVWFEDIVWQADFGAPLTAVIGQYCHFVLV